MRLVVALMVLSLLPFAQAQQVSPPVWVINDHVVLSEDHVHRGLILIEDGGTLEVRASRLALEMPMPIEPIMRIESGGRFFLNGTEDHPAILTDGELDVEDVWDLYLDYHYWILVEPGAIFEGKTCILEDLGMSNQYRAAQGVIGWWGLSSLGTVKLGDCMITQAFHAIDVVGGNLMLSDVSVEDSRGPPISVSDANATLRNVSLDKLIGFTRMNSLRIDSLTLDPSDQFPARGAGFQMADGATSVGIVSKVVVHAHERCVSLFGGIIKVNDVILNDCIVALAAADGGDYLVENLVVENAQALGSQGAITIANNAVLTIQNASISAKGTTIWFQSGGGTVTLRNVEWDGGVNGLLDDGAGFVHVENLLEVRVEGNGTMGLEVRIKQAPFEKEGVPNTGRTQTALTDKHGVARFYVHKETIHFTREDRDTTRHSIVYDVTVGDQTLRHVALKPSNTLTIALQETTPEEPTPQETTTPAALSLLLLALVFALWRHKA